jgi:hypothetical protein
VNILGANNYPFLFPFLISCFPDYFPFTSRQHLGESSRPVVMVPLQNPGSSGPHLLLRRKKQSRHPLRDGGLTFD